MRKPGLFLALLLCLGSLQAQVPVHQEPFHVPVFENPQIRVLNVQIPPGDTSLFHLHHTPSLFIFLSNTATGTELQGKSPTYTRLTTGRLLYENLAAPHTRIHRVWNTDTDTLHVIDVELLGKDSGFVRPPLTLSGLTLEIDTPWVRAYRLKLEKGVKFELKNNPSLLLVSFDQGSIDIRKDKESGSHKIKPGWFIDLPRQRSFSVLNTGAAAIQLVLVELPGS